MSVDAWNAEVIGYGWSKRGGDVIDLITRVLIRQIASANGRNLLRGAFDEVRESAAFAQELVAHLESKQFAYESDVAKGKAPGYGPKGKADSLVRLFYNTARGSSHILPEDVSRYCEGTDFETMQGALRWASIVTGCGLAVQASLAIQASRCTKALPASPGLGFYPADAYRQPLAQYPSGGPKGETLGRILDRARASAPAPLRDELDKTIEELKAVAKTGVWISPKDAARLHGLLVKFQPYWIDATRAVLRELGEIDRSGLTPYWAAAKWLKQALTVFDALNNDHGPMVLYLWYLQAACRGIVERCGDAKKVRAPGLYIEFAIHELAYALVTGLKSPFRYETISDSGRPEFVTDRPSGDARKRKGLERARLLTVWNRASEFDLSFGSRWRAQPEMACHMEALRAFAATLDRAVAP